MGTNYSNLKNQFSSKKVPKHLRPGKQKRRPKDPPLEPKQSFVKVLIHDDDAEFAEEETALVGSGPRGAFRWFKGRRYLNYVKQGGVLDTGFLPNDQLELDRIRVLSFIIRWAFKGNILAPVQEELKTGIQVLNVGYGPGMWSGHHMIDMAMDYPNSQFTVIDVADLLPADFEEATAEDPLDNENNISQFTPMHPNLPQKLQNTTTPVLDSSITLDSNSSFSNVLLSQIEESQGTIDSIISNVQEHTVDPQTNTPKLRRLLSNLDFYQINIVDGKLPFPDNHFDFVKQRLVTASFTLADWKRVMEELVRVTKPGGYIQLLEIDYNTFNLGPNGRAWELQLLETARQKRMMEPRIARHLPDILKSVGLIDVSSKLVSIPLGSWGLDLGSLWKHNMEMFADSSSPLLSKLAGVSVSEYRRRWRDMFEEVKDQKAFSNIHAAWGKKSSNNTIDWSNCTPLFDNL